MTDVLVAFFTFQGLDDQGRNLDDYLLADDNWWEGCHNHIQWAFPLPEPSRMNLAAPVATDEFYQAVQDRPSVRYRLLALVDRYTRFLQRTTLWRRGHDHNHLRITRVLRCLTLSGLTEQAEAFHQEVLEGAAQVNPKSRWYWAEALNANPAWL